MLPVSQFDSAECTLNEASIKPKGNKGFCQQRKLGTWLQGNKLSLNVAKTHSTLISTKQQHNILMGQNEDLKLIKRENGLKVVKTTKNVGFPTDCSLDWKEQNKAVSVKVSRAVGFLKHAKSFLPKETLRSPFTGIVELQF